MPQPMRPLLRTAQIAASLVDPSGGKLLQQWANNGDTAALKLSKLQQRLNQESGVNIDQEMTSLLNLQSAYGANARVFSVVKEMFATLLNM